jgi:hypothetical protein
MVRSFHLLGGAFFLFSKIKHDEISNGNIALLNFLKQEPEEGEAVTISPHITVT